METDGRATVIVLRDGAEVARFVIAAPFHLSVVDGLARLQLMARRHGSTVVVRGAGEDIRALVRLAGLEAVVPCAGRSVDVGGEPEGGEEPGVEEVVVTDDPVA